MERQEETQKLLPWSTSVDTFPTHILHDAVFSPFCNHSSNHAIFFQNLVIFISALHSCLSFKSQLKGRSLGKTSAPHSKKSWHSLLGDFSTFILTSGRELMCPNCVRTLPVPVIDCKSSRPEAEPFSYRTAWCRTVGMSTICLWQE